MDDTSKNGQTPLKSALYDKHIELVSKSRLAEFAGYLMPLWYSSISAEHRAVRNTAGLFDCTHMGVLEISGPDSESFLNNLTTNNVSALLPGKSQYSYVLNESGGILDDIIVSKLDECEYMVVVNAANESKIKDWIEPVVSNCTGIVFKDLKNSGAKGKVDMALQGPKSAEILSLIIDDETLNEKVQSLKPFTFVCGEIAGIDVIISRTGYTGAKIGFEIFIQADKAPWMWDMILEKGKELGAIPCGLGARDSLRIEAGLPLYGHELAGPQNITPFEAGYGWAVKLEKNTFIGKDSIADTSEMKVIRISMPGEKGVRPIREGDGVVSGGEVCIGEVLSCAKAGDKQIAICYIQKKFAEEGTVIGVYYMARSKGQVAKGRKEKAITGETLDSDIAGIIVSRFERF
jgi:glycine cleavage system T protein